MAKDMNSFSGSGYISSDLKLSYTQGGTAYLPFQLANNDIQKKGDQTVKVVHYFDCVAWTGLAETLQKYCAKGSQIGIEAKIQQDRWEDDKGNKHSKIKFVIREVKFFGDKKSDGNGK
jgi:single-strand DNA-binding protein